MRLPTLNEWRLATGITDSQRVYPWGDLFDAAFVAGYRGGNETAEGQFNCCRGPYGHQDLAGSVRVGPRWRR